jgi:hypothetical protein
MMDFIGFEEDYAGEEQCQNNKELWYDGHTGTDFEYSLEWHETGEYSDECHLDRFDISDYRYVFAPAKGRIHIIQFNDPYNGNAIFIKHDLNGNGNYDDDKFRSAYLHFHFINPDLAINQVIDEGRMLGLGGMTGQASTPHLHFEVQRSTQIDFSSKWPVDPFGWTGVGDDPSPYDNYILWIHRNNLPFIYSSTTDTYEPNNTFSTAYPVSKEVWYYSYIWSMSDQDWYRFHVSSSANPQFIEVWLYSIPIGTNYNRQLYGPNQDLLSGSYNSENSPESISYWTDQSGDYRIKIYSVSGFSTSTRYMIFFRVRDAPSYSPYP